MVCKSEVFVGTHAQNTHVTNWNGDVSFTAEEYFGPGQSGEDALPSAGLLSLVHVVARATDEQKPLKAIGSGWSFEDICKPDAWLVRLNRIIHQLDYVIGPTGAALTDEWRARQFDPTGSQRLVHVEAGIEVGALNELLAAKGLAMRSLGGSNGQSLAGAISTSTHGGDWREPPLPDFVRAIHLVTVGGQELWIERASEPITQDDRLLPVLPCHDTIPIRNDETFNAVLVSCGRFGVIYSFVLEVRTAFRVVEVTTTPARKQLLQSLRDGLNTENLYGPLFDLLKTDPPPAGLAEAAGVIATTNPSFFQLLFNSQDPEECWVQRRWETTAADDLLPAAEYVPDGFLIVSIAQAALSAAAALAMLVPVVGPLYALQINKVQIEIQLHALDPRISRGEAMALVLNAIWKLPFIGHTVRDIAHEVLAGRFEKLVSEGRRGSHHLITSGTREESQNLDYRADSIELVFDATTPAYLDFLEKVLDDAPKYRQCGYVSLRPSQSSRATLSMHNVASPRAVSIECATLKGLPDNRDWMKSLEREAVHRGGRPHWGQINNLNEPQVTALYGRNLIAWREALLRVSGDSTLFSNHFTRQRGLEPLNLVRRVTAVRRTMNGVTTHLCGPAGSEWSPINVRDAIQQAKAGIAQYFTQVGDKVAFLEIVGDEYLRTRADAAPENNLDNLPECP